MKLSRSKKTETALFHKFREYLDRSLRTGVHVSDLMSPLLTYWKRKAPKSLTDDECLYFLAGQAHHYFLVAAVTGVEGTQEESLYDAETGITYSPDLLQMRGEFKTTRAQRIPQSEEEVKRKFAEYIKQCRAYAALARSNTWKLIVYFLSVPDTSNARYTRNRVYLRAYELTFTDTELAKERRRLKELSAALTSALTADSPDALPLCAAWKCYESVDGQKVGKCQWWNDCKPAGRHPAAGGEGWQKNFDESGSW